MVWNHRSYGCEKLCQNDATESVESILLLLFLLPWSLLMPSSYHGYWTEINFSSCPLLLVNIAHASVSEQILAVLQQCYKLLFWVTLTSKSYKFLFAAAAAKSLQSYPTLCDPIDGSPPGSPVPGILQARIPEWVAISFSNAWKWNCSVVSDSSWPHGPQPTRLLYPWDFPGKSTGVGCDCLLQRQT